MNDKIYVSYGVEDCFSRIEVYDLNNILQFIRLAKQS